MMTPSIWDYPIMLIQEQDELPGARDEFYYFVWLPDFGHVACSAMGETVDDALANLQNVLDMVLAHYIKTGREIPEPNFPPGVRDA